MAFRANPGERGSTPVRTLVDMTFRRWGPLSALLALLALGCGRLHEQIEGVYTLTAQEVILDDCGIAPTLSGPHSLELIITGDWVRARLSAFDMPMVGRFLSSVERFNLDGTVANATEPDLTNWRRS